jgi:hypothetical protein
MHGTSMNKYFFFQNNIFSHSLSPEISLLSRS